MKHRIDRGLLLRILLSYFPQEASPAALHVALEVQRGSEVSDEDFQFNIEYLVQGGYVARRALHTRKMLPAYYKITNAGIQLVKGSTAQDPEISL